jgi:hypothetical protein
MPFDVGSAINSAADWLCGSALVKGIVSNPIFTALLLTSIAIVIILGMYYREFRAGGKKKMLRMTIYLLGMIAAVVFVHHYAVERCIRTDAAQKGVREVFQGIAESRQINPTNVSVAVGGRSSEGIRELESNPHIVSPPPAPLPVAAHERPDNVGGEVEEDVRDMANGLQIEDVVVA